MEQGHESQHQCRLLLTQAVARRCMIPSKFGKIINISSVAGLAGGSVGTTTIAYCTSKGAVLDFTRALASEWGKYNINVNAVCPGYFPTKMTFGHLEKVGEALIAATPLHRLGGKDDIKGVVAFLWQPKPRATSPANTWRSTAGRASPSDQWIPNAPKQRSSSPRSGVRPKRRSTPACIAPRRW
ncbi:MAG: SDR family oxidoreductase [Ilumatobacteraceae bacterium]